MRTETHSAPKAKRRRAEPKLSPPEKIKAVRELRGLQQTTCAKRARVTKSTWNGWENATEPKVKAAVKIARVLGVTVEELWGDDVSLAGEG